MSSYKPIDNKRDQFRRYVENNGIFEMLSKVLIQLMNNPEKPENPIDFIRENVGASLKEMAHVELLQQEVNAYRQQVEDLTKQLEEARQQNKSSAPVADTPAQDAAVEPKAEAAAVVDDTVTVDVLVEDKPSVVKSETIAEVEIVNATVTPPPPTVEPVAAAAETIAAVETSAPVDSAVSPAVPVSAPSADESPKEVEKAVQEEPASPVETDSNPAVTTSNTTN